MSAITRRTFLYGAGAAAAVAGLGLPSVSASTAAGKRVAVLGGGMAGLVVAHELVERGFDVTVFERKALGGKARSIPVPGTGQSGRLDRRASTASGSSPASTTTCRTPCAGSRSPATPTA